MVGLGLSEVSKMTMQATMAALLANLRPSTLAGVVYDLGWALEDGDLPKSQYAWACKMALDELVRNQGVDKARELIAAEGEALPQQ